MENLIVEKFYFNLLSIHLAEVRLATENAHIQHDDEGEKAKYQDRHGEKKCFQSVVIFLIVSKLNFNGFPFLLPPRFRSFYALLYFIFFLSSFSSFFGDTNCFPFMRH